MNSIEMKIGAHGTLIVYHPLQAGDVEGLPGAGTGTRGGYVLPLNPVKRLAFCLLRRVFGGAGQVAAWTRTWGGKWTVVDAITGRSIGIYLTHNHGVRAEINYILRREYG